MNLRHLRYFIALSERLNFTHAAASVNVTQSTLSHQIRNLEDELGFALFNRNSRTVALTHAGEALLPGARLTLRQLDLSLREARDAAKGMRPDCSEFSGALTVLVGTHAFGVGLFPSCLQQFVERHPRVRIVREEAAAAQFIPRLQAGQHDFGCGDEPPPGSGLLFEPLYRQELVLAVRPNHPLAGRDSLRMIELHALPVALMSDAIPTRRVIEESLRVAGARPNVVAEITQTDQLLALARRADLAVIVTRNSAEAMEGLVQIALEEPKPMRTLGLLWKSEREVSKVARAFSEAVRLALQAPDAHAPDWLRVETYLRPRVAVRPDAWAL